MSDSTDSESETETILETSLPFDISEAAKAALNETIPEASRDKYLAVYSKFTNWKKEKKLQSSSEDVLLAYFYELSLIVKPPTLWSRYSILKLTVNVLDNVCIKYPKLTAFIKRKNEGYEAKKAKTFTADEVRSFLDNAPNEIYLPIKVSGRQLVSNYEYSRSKYDNQQHFC